MLKSGSIRSSPGFLTLFFSAAISLVWVVSVSASSPPSIDSESATKVTQNDATLNAEINPNGSYAAYEFQIDTNSSYSYTQPVCPLPVPGYVQCMAIVAGDPLPPGLVEPSPQSIPAGSGDRSVSLDLASIGATLQPGTTYHYRVIASSGGPVVYGADQTFTTPPTTSQPSIDGESATNVTPTDATLNAQINPNGLVTSYQFEIAKPPACLPVPAPYMPCAHVETGDLPVATIPSGNGDQSVNLDLASASVALDPNTTYWYRVTATNAAGPMVGGPNQAFTTPTAPASVDASSADGGTHPVVVPTAPPSSRSSELRYKKHEKHHRNKHKHRKQKT